MAQKCIFYEIFIDLLRIAETSLRPNNILISLYISFQVRVNGQLI